MQYTGVHVMAGADTPWSGGSGHRVANIRRQFFLVDDEERNVHFRGAYEIAAERWSPLHRHTFEQIRYQTGGDQTYGKHRWHKGTFGYFPEAVHYGPHTSGPGGFQEIDLQWPSPTGGYFGSNEALIKAMGALKEAGVKMENGLAIWPDGRKQDSTEACWEQLLGGKIEYAEGRYREPVFVETETLPWVASDRTGVETRQVGSFAYGPQVSLVKLAPGASTAGGKLPAGFWQVRFVADGDVSYGGKRCEGVSCLYYPAGVEHGPLESEGGGTALVIQIPVRPGTFAPLVV